MRLYKFNEPKWFIPLGFFSCLVCGSAWPIFGVQYASATSFLTIPFSAIEWVYPEEYEGYTDPKLFI